MMTLRSAWPWFRFSSSIPFPFYVCLPANPPPNVTLKIVETGAGSFMAFCHWRVVMEGGRHVTKIIKKSHLDQGTMPSHAPSTKTWGLWRPLTRPLSPLTALDKISSPD
jgi:hypothetical protein